MGDLDLDSFLIGYLKFVVFFTKNILIEKVVAEITNL